MSALGVRSGLIEGATTGLRTGLVWVHRIGTGAFQESHRQVLVADLSTSVQGAARPTLDGSAPDLPGAANDRELNTGV